MQIIMEVVYIMEVEVQFNLGYQCNDNVSQFGGGNLSNSQGMPI